MKTISSAQKFMGVVAIAITLASLKVMADQGLSQGTMRDFQLHTCTENKKKCVSVEAMKAEGSQLRELVFFRDPKVVVSEDLGGKTRSHDLKCTSGYLDLELNRLVLRNGKQEQAVELGTMKIVKY